MSDGRSTDVVRTMADAKFGMFVHWGAYAAAGAEASWPVMLGPELWPRWLETIRMLGVTDGVVDSPAFAYDEYQALPAQFRAERFDADEWAELAAAAGQRYLVLTTKHHDGFCLFDTETTDHASVRAPIGRDVVADVAGACRAAGVGFGAYFSLPDIAHPGYRDLSAPIADTFLGQPERPEWSAFVDDAARQVTELVTGYGELFSLWWDLGFDDAYDATRLCALVREHQPACLMNDRLGNVVDGTADFQTPEQSIPRAIPHRSAARRHQSIRPLFDALRRDDWREIVKPFAQAALAARDAPGDPSVPDPGDFQPWEACMTFGGMWAWAPSLAPAALKTGDNIVRDLVEVASRGGNLLMNVGPRGDGTIQPEFRTALLDVGRWLGVNGRAIYGTTFGPVQGRPGIRTTQALDGGPVFVHVVDWPADGRLVVPGIRSTSAVPVAGGAGLTVDEADGAVVVHLDGVVRTGPVTVLELTTSP